MGKNTLKIGLMTGITFLFLSTLCFPVINANEGKPDLTIEEIYVHVAPRGGRLPWEMEYLKCKYRNVGDGDVTEKDVIQFQIVVEKLLFNKLPIRVIMNICTHGYSINHGLEAGSTFNETLIYHYLFVLPGYMKFKCTVNPNRLIEESNYDNNYIEKTFFGYIGWRTYRWIPVD